MCSEQAMNTDYHCCNTTVSSVFMHYHCSAPTPLPSQCPESVMSHMSIVAMSDDPGMMSIDTVPYITTRTGSLSKDYVHINHIGGYLRSCMMA